MEFTITTFNILQAVGFGISLYFAYTLGKIKGKITLVNQSLNYLSWLYENKFNIPKQQVSHFLEEHAKEYMKVNNEN